MLIIDGRAIAHRINKRTRQLIDQLNRQGVNPTLAEIMVGDDPASDMYLRLKSRQANRLGVGVIIKRLPVSASPVRLLQLVRAYNCDARINGITVQSPLPATFRKERVDQVIMPQKDADGMNPFNLGRLLVGDSGCYPVGGTPAGIMTILRSVKIRLAGRRVVIIGRSRIVGRPLVGLLINAGALVTVLNHYAIPLSSYTRNADVIISAAGQINLLTAVDVKPGATVIDVGENPTPQGHLVGDADFRSIAHKAGAITPVPGGVGPVTVATLMNQVVKLTKWSLKRNERK